MELEGKVALITGAGSGIGRTTAVTLARAGASLFLMDRDEAGLAGTAGLVRETGRNCEWAIADVTDPAAVNGAIERCVAIFGRLDIAHNNAGVSSLPVEFAEVPVEEATRIVNINFWGVFYCLQAEIRQMLKQGGGGAIINTSSGAGLVATPGLSSYCGAKHGVIGLTKSVGAEYAGRGIRINAVCPGVVETPMSAPNLADVETRKMLEAAHPIGRLAQCQDIADVVLWLASDRSKYIVGAAIPADGGYTLV